jgi:hypothetical protein
MSLAILGPVSALTLFHYMDALEGDGFAGDKSLLVRIVITIPKGAATNFQSHSLSLLNSTLQYSLLVRSFVCSILDSIITPSCSICLRTSAPVHAHLRLELN